MSGVIVSKGGSVLGQDEIRSPDQEPEELTSRYPVSTCSSPVESLTILIVRPEAGA